MSLRPEATSAIPDETVRVATAAFPKGNRYLQLRDAFGPLFDDTSFADRFAARGHPAESPWRLALVTVWQFAEGLTDRQAADSVRARLDGKYALGMPLTDPGFHYSLLSTFRSRVVAGNAEQRLLDGVLDHCRRAGLLRARGTQRTDAPQVLGAVRTLNRLELVGEVLRAAVNALAGAAPAWLGARDLAGWQERYARRVEAYRLPKGQAARSAYGVQVGTDGLALLAAVWAADAPAALRALPAVALLRQVWGQH